MATGNETRKDGFGGLWIGETIAVREVYGRNRPVRYALHRLTSKADVIYVCGSLDDALHIAQSVDAHGGNFSAAKRSKWSTGEPLVGKGSGTTPRTLRPQ